LPNDDVLPTADVFTECFEENLLPNGALLPNSAHRSVSSLYQFLVLTKRYNLAAWDLVRKPKAKGGLGVINLSIQNNDLLLKQLDKFYRKAKIQWVALIWNKYYSGIVPHLAREKGYSRTSCFFIEVLLHVALAEGILLSFGRTLSMVKFMQMYTLICLLLLKNLRFRFGALGMLLIC
jgi:hypothetical protein